MSFPQNRNSSYQDKSYKVILHNKNKKKRSKFKLCTGMLFFRAVS